MELPLLRLNKYTVTLLSSRSVTVTEKLNWPPQPPEEGVTDGELRIGLLAR